MPYGEVVGRHEPLVVPCPSMAGLVRTILGMGVLYLLVPLGMFFNRSLRQMDTRFHH